MRSKKNIILPIAIWLSMFFSVSWNKAYGKSFSPEIKNIFSQDLVIQGNTNTSQSMDTIHVANLEIKTFRNVIQNIFNNNLNLQQKYGSNAALFATYCKTRNTLASENKTLEVSDYFVFDGFEIMHYNELWEIKSQVKVIEGAKPKQITTPPIEYNNSKERIQLHSNLTIKPNKWSWRELYKTKILQWVIWISSIGEKGRTYLLDHIEFNNPKLSEHHQLILSGNSLSLFNSSTWQNFIIEDIHDPHKIQDSGLANVNTDTIALPEHFYSIENGKVVHNCVINAQNYQTALIQYTLTKKDAIKTIQDLERLQNIDSLSKSKYSFIGFDYETIYRHILSTSKVWQRNVFDIYARTNYGHNFTYFVGIVDEVYGFRAADSDRWFKKDDWNPQIKSLLYHIKNFYFDGETSHKTHKANYVKNVFIRRIPDPNFIIKKMENKIDSIPNNTVPWKISNWNWRNSKIKK